ncbi:hypothetical protein ES703_14392 [subsurface metagenome]
MQANGSRCQPPVCAGRILKEIQPYLLGGCVRLHIAHQLNGFTKLIILGGLAIACREFDRP